MTAIRKMMGLEQIDLMARGGSLALLALWSWLMVRDYRHALPARMAVLMNFSIACHILATMPQLNVFEASDFFFEIFSVTVPGMFWLFARTWFNDETRVGWRSWAAIGLAMLLLASVWWNYPSNGSLFWFSVAALRAMMFGFCAAGLWVVWRGRDGDLLEARRRLRVRLVGAVGVYVLLVNTLEILILRDLGPQTLRTYIEIGITLLTFGFCAAMFQIRQADMFGRRQAQEPVEPDLPNPSLIQLGERLHKHMDNERAWRDESLSIAKLAGQLGEQEYRLRRVINGQLGHRNFAAFLNGYRLGEVKSALADPTQTDVPIITIALDAGFGSLGPFNRAFREAEGMTPSEYRAASAG
jgi:AraC-like DNA-binding protein